MGSLFSAKQKTKTNQTQTQNVTNTPTNPQWVTDAAQGLTSQVNALGQTDPYQYVAGSSPLQQQAFDTAAGGLGGWQGANQAGQALAMMGALGGPNLAGQRGSQASNPLYGGMTTQGGEPGRSTSLPFPVNEGAGAYTYQAPQIGQTTLGPTTQATPATLGPAPQGQATGFNAPQIGQAVGYNAPQADMTSILQGLGAAPSVTAGAASAGSVGPAAQAAAQQAQAVDPSSLISRYMNPYTSQVYDTTMADFDAQAGRTQAAQAAQAAAAGAFGGSRYGIREAETAAGLDRARAATGAGILDQGFQTSLGAALQDAGLRSQLAGLNAQLGTDTSQFNAGQSNENARTQAGLTTQAGIANANNTTQANIAQGGFARDYGLAGLDAQTRAALANLDWQGRAAEFGAGAQNTRNLAQGQLDYGAQAQSNDYANRFGLENLGLAGQYGLQQGAFNQQANLANTGWQNESTLAQGQLDQSRNLAQGGLDAGAAEFGAAANNQMSQFNAQQREQALARLLSGAGLMGQFGSDAGNQQRADVGLQGALGEQQRAIEQARRTAPLSLLQAQSQLYPWQAMNLFQGNNTSGTMNLSGTNVQTSTPSPFSIGMSLASLFAPSDPALKTDISPAGRENGFNLYNYRYLWDDPDRPKRTGVMADEIEDIRPDAVAVVNGMRVVDYGALGLAHLVEA